jgi:uncharacterized protein involved in exopolysaccharide biosynthesis
MADREPRVSLLMLAALILRRPGIILVVPLLFALGTVAYSLIRGREFVAKSTFIAEAGENKAAGLAGLAAQFGVEVPDLGGEGASLDFSASVLESKELLRDAVLTRYRFATREGSADTLEGNLVELLRAKGKTPEARLRNAVKRLDKRVDVITDAQADVVRLSVVTYWPDLSVQVNRRMLELLNQFNMNQRRSRGRAEREFVEQRLAEVKAELDGAERTLARFLERNRSYHDSPQLNAEHSRLQRQVMIQQALYTHVMQAYEEARVDEVRDTPVITVVDAPDGFAERAWSLVVRALVAFIIGLVVAIALILFKEFVTQQRSANPEDFARFDEARRAALNGLATRRRIARTADPAGTNGP